MELLAFQPASAPQVAGALRVHPGTARRLLNRLVADGWLIRSGGRRRTYTPTMRVVAMAAQLADRDLLPERGDADRRAAARGDGAGSRICASRATARRCASCTEPATTEARPQFRELVPAHATAAGKVLLGSS